MFISITSAPLWSLAGFHLEPAGFLLPCVLELIHLHPFSESLPTVIPSGTDSLPYYLIQQGQSHWGLMRLFIKHFRNEKCTTNTKVVKAFGSMWKFLCLLKFCFIFKREGVNHSNFNLIRQIFIEHRFVDKYEYNLFCAPTPPLRRFTV